MKKCAIISLVVLIMVMPSTPVFCMGPFHGDLNFVVAVPQGEFDRELDNDGYGLSGRFSYAIPNSFVSFGGSLGYLMYGSETREEPFSTTIPGVTVEVKTTNSVVTGHLFLRAQVPADIVRPYVDGLVGVHHLRTDTRIRGEDYEEIASSNNFNDTSLSYGGGGGVMLRVYHGPRGTRGLEVLIDAGAHYLKGGEAEYLEEGSIERNGPDISYQVSESNTDMVLIYFGVSVVF